VTRAGIKAGPVTKSCVVELDIRTAALVRDLSFRMAASVFDEARLVDLVHEEELLVTYAPRKVLPRGLAGDTSHALHYVMTSYGTLEDYYEHESYKMNPVPEKLLGPLVYDGDIKVGLNFDPEL
jgi:hypothetical protein